MIQIHPVLERTATEILSVSYREVSTVLKSGVIAVTLMMPLLGCARSPNGAARSETALQTRTRIDDQPEYRRSVETLRRMGARLEFDSEDRVTVVSLAQPKVGDSDLLH